MVVVSLLSLGAALGAAAAGEPKTRIASFPHDPDGPVTVFRLEGAGGPAIAFRSVLRVDADGAPTAYHPTNDRLALDVGKSAGYPPGSKDILAWDEKAGRPYVQTAAGGDPAPGFMVSMTTLEDTSVQRVSSPARYVDASRIPYFVLAPKTQSAGYVPLGALGVVVNLRNGKWSAAVFADVSPPAEQGEGSLFLRNRLADRPRADAKGGTLPRDILYLVFPQKWGAHPEKPWPHTLAEIDAEGKKRFEAWGGMERARQLVRELD